MDEIIDSLQGYPCAQEVLDSAIKLNNAISDILRKVFKDSTIQNNLTFVSRSDLRDNKGRKLDGFFEGRTISLAGGTTITGTVLIDKDILLYGTEEMILAIMLHESLHAYLALEREKLGEILFSSKYPSIDVYSESDPNNVLNKRYSFITTDNHSQMATAYRTEISGALKEYNPNLPNSVADALSVNGFFRPTSFPNEPMLLVGYERDTRIKDPVSGVSKCKGTKCN